MARTSPSLPRRRYPVVLLLGLLAWAAALPAQQFTYQLTSSPDSVEVFLGGTHLGHTPLDATIDWSQAPEGGFVFTFSRPGYKDSTFVVAEKPRYKENFKDMKLEKKHPRFELAPDAVLVNFDKFMTELPLGKAIGRNKTFYGGDITWEAYSRIGRQEFSLKADDVLGSAGFRTPRIKRNELFSSQDTTPKTARYLIGGKLTDIWVELGPTTMVGIRAKNWCTIQWQVYDKVEKKVVLSQVSRGEFEGKYINPTEYLVMMDLFQDAMENFLHDGKLAALVQAAGPYVQLEEERVEESKKR